MKQRMEQAAKATLILTLLVTLLRLSCPRADLPSPLLTWSDLAAFTRTCLLLPMVVTVATLWPAQALPCPPVSQQRQTDR